MVKGGSIALGFQAMLQELGVSLEIKLRCDAGAAVGIVMRRGLGKLRHIDVTQLWLQEKVASGKIKIMKVRTTENKSDLLTKYHATEGIKTHFRMTSQEFAQS